MPGGLQYINYSRNRLAAAGYSFDAVERYDPYTKKSSDFCGFADLIAFHPLVPGTLAIQVTSSTHISDHLIKYRVGKANKFILDWLRAGNRFELWAWGFKAQRSSCGSFLVKKGSSTKAALNRLAKRIQSSDRRFTLIDHDTGFDYDVVESSELLPSGPDISLVATEWNRLQSERVSRFQLESSDALQSTRKIPLARQSRPRRK